MRTSTRGLEAGTRIRVKGAGKLSKGSVVEDEKAPAGFISYRTDYNSSIHLVAIDRVRKLLKPRSA